MVVRGQDKSNWGKEFWLIYGLNFWSLNDDGPTPKNSQNLSLYISTRQQASVRVFMPNTGFDTTLNIPANQVDFGILVPKTGPNDARILDEGLSNRGICIKSDVPVAAYAHQYNSAASGATLLMPMETYGYAYYSVNYTQGRDLSTLPDLTPVAINTRFQNWFSVVAPEDNTRIIISPSDTTQGGWVPQKQYTIDLKKGEVYTLVGKSNPGISAVYAMSKDLTGTKVVSVVGADGKCHPVSAFSGSGAVRICKGDGGEYMGQQLFPNQAWGTRYLTYHMINIPKTSVTGDELKAPFPNIYRVCVQDPATKVKLNGELIDPSKLIKNFYYEYHSTTGDYIESDKPILVVQYTPNRNECKNSNSPSYGDPEMIFLSPIEQGQKSILFYTSGNKYIDYVYVNIYVKASAAASLKLDGKSLPPEHIFSHPTLSSYAVAVAKLDQSNGQHTLVCDSNFNATIYGIGLFESYGYNAGTLINDLNTYTHFRNAFSTGDSKDTVACVGTEFVPTIKIGYKLSRIQWKLRNVGGLNFNRDSIINDPIPSAIEKINGRNYYAYTLQSGLIFNTPGVKRIPVSYTASEIDACENTMDTAISMIVREGPVADFKMSSVVCIGKSATFDALQLTSGYRVKLYRWDFPDNTNATSISISKTYLTAGDRNVKLMLVTENGCYDDTVKSLSVIAQPQVKVSVMGKPCLDSLQTLGSSILSGNNTAATWYWELGSGQNYTSKTTHTASAQFKAIPPAGSLKHWVVFDQGCSSDTISFTLPALQSAPLPIFSVLADTLCPGALVVFESGNKNGITDWRWNFGDGNAMNGLIKVSNRFAASGNYNVSLSVMSDKGCGSLPFSRQVSINKVPQVSAGPDKYVKKGSSVLLQASIINPAAYQLRWSPATFLTQTNILTPTSKPDMDMRYVISARDINTFCVGYDTVNIFLLSDILIPNTFTPNGDGINDRWEIKSLEQYVDASVEVYTTNGQLIFRSKGYTVAWEGNFKGKPIPAGIYYYVIDLGEGSALKAGYVTIFR